MQIVPDWAPNIHPMIVHFPIVLLTFAVIFDFLFLFLKKFGWLEKSALSLYVVGTLAIIVTFFTGRFAADGLDIPAKVIPAVTDHADWAEITLWFFIIFSAVRLTIGLWKKQVHRAILFIITIISLTGIYSLYQTADHGAKLVFGYGLGTGNILEKVEQMEKETKSDESIFDSTLKLDTNGSWKLIATTQTITILKEKFKWIESSIEDVSPMFDEENSAMMFHPQKEATFIYNDKIKSVQITAKINVDEFDGELEFIHHFNDNNNYDFLRIRNGEISLARKSHGQTKIFEKDKFADKGFIEIKVIGDGTHFRGYVNNKMIVHGHGSEPKPGSVGIRINGQGSFYLNSIDVISLRQ